MSKITSLIAQEILDSRGNPTLEVSCVLENGTIGKASVPSGASTGSHEAVELRDGGERYNGLGVLTLIKSIEGEICEYVKNKELDQEILDKALIDLDGTENKSRLGANAILGVSLAFARAEAAERKTELYEYIAEISGTAEIALPEPMFNIVNGGKHADSGLDIQEFMIGPRGIPTFREKVRAAAEIVASLRAILKEKGLGTGIGDEGGFAPKFSSNEEALDVIIEAIKKAGYDEKSVGVGIDAAASEFFAEGAYELKIGGEKKKASSAELVEWYITLFEKYPLMSIEDGLSEDDWDGFAYLRERLPEVMIVGDDLTATNYKLIEKAAGSKAITSVLIKPNQIGTLSETLAAIARTKKESWAAFVSHRSGETLDTFIADLAVGTGAAYIKSGAPVRGERIAKYNRLMEIEHILKK